MKIEIVRPPLLENMPELVKRLVSKTVTFSLNQRAHQPHTCKQSGFSLVELLIVVAVIGIVASLAVPHLQRGIRAADAGNTVATMKTISSTQLSHYSQQGRFARLGEINTIMSGGIGTPSGSQVVRGKFVLEMVPESPSDSDLQDAYTITATRDLAGEDIIYLYELTQSGEVRQILP